MSVGKATQVVVLYTTVLGTNALLPVPVSNLNSH